MNNTSKKSIAENYYHELEYALKSGEMSIALNKDRIHNAVIMRLMLDKSDNICMYCGEMSIFRESFYNHINEDEDGLGDELRKQMISSMTKFLNRNGSTIQIILEQEMKSIPDDLIFDEEFIDAAKKNRIYISYLQEGMVLTNGMAHFSFTDKIIRMEKDKKEHSAICAVNAPDSLTDNTRYHFANLKEVTTPVCLN